MKYFSLIILLFMLSCGNKEDILLPKSNKTIVRDVKDHSPIYIFFRVKGKDTVAEVNRKNEIISTNWIFNIDKRLPLRTVIPEIIKLQEKKRNEKAHKNEEAQNYYSYADSVGKNMAFLPFTEVYYKIEKPKSENIVFFDRHNIIWVNNVTVKKEDLQGYLNSLSSDKHNKLLFCFDRNLSFDRYLQDKVLLQSYRVSKPEMKLKSQEFIY